MSQEHEARWFFQQLIIALDYAHRMNVVSRDIKLENTSAGTAAAAPLLKICDFGYSKNTEKDSVPKSRVGTPGYTGKPSPPSLQHHCPLPRRCAFQTLAAPMSAKRTCAEADAHARKCA